MDPKESNYLKKKEALMASIDTLCKNDIMIAFSGGVDSSLLLKICCLSARQQGSTVYAITASTELHPMADLAIARRVAAEAGAKHLIVHINELEESDIRFNPVDRCYLCKKSIFQKLVDAAMERNISNILEGSNEDDMHVYRPGIRAIRELGILSPLAEHGITKEEVRKMAAEYGISVANRPSTPCMATRFPYGAELTLEKMKKADQGEEILRQAGFYNVRFRIHDNIARIEIDKDSMAIFLQMYDGLRPRLLALGLDYITLDMEGFRSGSMDIHVAKTSK